jgi:hypothetical protein
VQHTRTPHFLQTHLFLSSSIQQLKHLATFIGTCSGAVFPSSSTDTFLRSTWVTFCLIEHQTMFHNYSEN